MEQLLSIKSIPIKVEFTTNNAQLQYSSDSVDMEVHRDKGGLQLRSSLIKVNIDTFQARNSVTPSPASSLKQFAEKGKTAAYQATSTYVQEGKLLMNAKIGEDAIGQILTNRSVTPPAQLGLDFIPKANAELSWNGGDLQIQYEMDKLNFDFKLGNGNFEFIPGNIQFSVLQQPDVVIEYVGGPIYVPPSADPSHVDLKV